MLPCCFLRSHCHTVVVGKHVVERRMRGGQEGVHLPVGHLLRPVGLDMLHYLHVLVLRCLTVESVPAVYGGGRR